MEKILDISVTELFCEYPKVKIEKQLENSLEKPKNVLSFVDFRLYTKIEINCKVSSQTIIDWFAYAMIEIGNSLTAMASNSMSHASLPKSANSFSSVKYKFIQIDGLQYTSQSEDIKVNSSLLSSGLHLICVNVAMAKVAELDSADCIYIRIILPNIVAGFNYGIGRSVRHGSIILMDAASSSYDPDVNTLPDIQDLSRDDTYSSSFAFQMSCPYSINSSLDGQTDETEQNLMFTSNSSK